MNSVVCSKRRIRRWGAGAVLATGAAVLGMGSAGADTPDDVIGQTIAELNQGNVVLDAASTADLSARQADALMVQTTLAPQTDPILLQLEGLQNNLPAGDQTLLGSVDEQLLTAAQNVVSADQAFVAADQAGELSSNSFLPIDLTALEADLGLGGAALNADFESFLTLFDPGFATDTAASAAVTTTNPADVLSQASNALTAGNQALDTINVSGIGDAFANTVSSQLTFDDHAIVDIGNLAAGENLITANDGGFSTIVNDLLTPIDQNIYQSSEAVLAADQAFQVALAADTGSMDPSALAAEIGLLSPDFQLLGDLFNALPIEFVGQLGQLF